MSANTSAMLDLISTRFGAIAILVACGYAFRRWLLRVLLGAVLAVFFVGLATVLGAVTLL